MAELVSAEISLSTEGLAECESLDLINRKLSDVEENLKRYTCTANRDDYAFAVFSGLSSEKPKSKLRTSAFRIAR